MQSLVEAIERGVKGNESRAGVVDDVLLLAELTSVAGDLASAFDLTTLALELEPDPLARGHQAALIKRGAIQDAGSGVLFIPSTALLPLLQRTRVDGLLVLPLLSLVCMGTDADTSNYPPQ